MDEGHVLDHGEMGALPDMNLQPRIGEATPAERMVAGDVRVVEARETGNRNIPRGLFDEIIVEGHLEFRADHRQHQLPQLGVIEQLLGRLDVEMADELGENVVGLSIWRKMNSKFRQLEQIASELLFERPEIQYSIRWSRPRRKQVGRPRSRPMNEPARGLIHGQAAETMSEEREWPIKNVLHLGHQMLDELVEIGDRLFADAAEPTGWLDRHHLDGRVQRFCPVVINGGAAAGERKAEQTQARRGTRADCLHRYCRDRQTKSWSRPLR